MKKIGIIGGLGPVATVDYYNEIINIFNEKNDDLVYPEIIIYSVNMSQFLNLMKAKKYDKVVEMFGRIIKSLKNAGAEFAAITANTPHLLFENIKEQSVLPLISIVEATSEEAKRLDLKNPGLFGTKFTMEASFYQNVFDRYGIKIRVPEKSDIDIINEKLFKEIELGIFKEDTKQQLLQIVKKMIAEKSIDGLILGCTEFPSVFRDKYYFEIPFLNTTRIHVNKIVEYCLSSSY